MFEFEQPADSLEHAAELSRTEYYWYIYGGNDYSKFDFGWRPAPWEMTHVHVFPSQWQRNGDVYLANKNTVYNKEWHFRTEQSVTRLHDHTNWEQIVPMLTTTKFDFSWHPDSLDPPYIYHFPSQHQSSSGLIYRVPTATDIKMSDAFVLRRFADESKWVVPEDIEPDSIDFSWHPNPLDPPYIYHFSSDWQSTTGLTYTVDGATEIKIIDEIPSTNPDKILRTLDIFYIDYINPNSISRFEKLKERYPNIQKVRYANSIMDTINRCCNRSSTNRFWVISSKNNYQSFDFTWHPETWQSYMTHVFPSQWQKWSDTFLINRNEFNRNSKWAKGIEEFPNLNFVKDQQVISESDGSNIYYVDHGNPTNQLARLQTQYPKLKVTRFVDNYLDVFKRIMATADTEYVWIIHSVCNYGSFDFTWHPEAWQSEMIHVFPSGTQKRGDTFYIHVESFKTQMYELEILDWFNVINYCEDQWVDRWNTPMVIYKEDSIISAIKEHNFEFPYAVFSNSPVSNINQSPCLWHPKDRIAEALTRSGSISVIPREIKAHLQKQIYDYPYVSHRTKNLLYEDQLDIIFISNGEPDEQKMFEHTEYMTNSDVKWIRGVNGRTAAYQAAARASTTPWFFAVFAKLEVVGNSFPWYSWQPDYWQEPKHYIFNAKNPVNGLEYGHQGMIAYNKKLVLENNNPGIDFTLSQPHESVPILSGTARFNQDPWMTWRTAFREVIKLIHFNETQPTLETTHRLHTWLTKAEGEYADWCLKGANDAAVYYNEVNGEYDKLMLSFDWAWLREKFTQCRTS